MVGAHLWKRILNEGAVGLSEGDVLDIIGAPIIVDTHAQDCGWEVAGDGLGLPFPKFWVEATGNDNDSWGSLVVSRKTDEGWEALMLMLSGGDGRPIHYGAASMTIDEQGFGKRPEFFFPPELSADGDESFRKRLIMTLESTLARVVRVLKTLGCKNVSLAPHDNDPKQVRRAIKRHGGTPESYRYHTLVVRTPGAHKDSPAQEIGIMPRHVCRGHFAEYGPEFNKGLLFGRYSGRFYIPPHLKGDKKNGVVEKDYAIPATA